MPLNIPESHVPEGYVVVRNGADAVVARPDLAEALSNAHALHVDRLTAASKPLATLQGRGAVAVVEFAGKAMVVRRDRRGGVLAALGMTVRLGKSKALDELRWSDDLRRRGVAVPEVYAVFLEEALPGCYRHSVATAWLKDTIDLAEVLRRELPRGVRRRMMVSAGRAVRALHDAGALHGDLNLKNILVDLERPDVPGVIIDLDRIGIPARMDLRARARNLARLSRSAAKLSFSERVRVTERDKLAFLRGYARGDRTLLRELVRRLAGRTFLLHRLRWMIFGVERRA